MSMDAMSLVCPSTARRQGEPFCEAERSLLADPSAHNASGGCIIEARSPSRSRDPRGVRVPNMRNCVPIRCCFLCVVLQERYHRPLYSAQAQVGLRMHARIANVPT
eukprot:2902700-Amphidinium_carterae.1